MESVLFYIKDGRVTNIKQFEPLRDGKYEAKRVKAVRSLPLNRYYWGCVVEYEREGFKNLGYDYSKEQVHAFNKMEFNYHEIVNEKTGEIKRIPASTANITNTVMMEMIDRIKIFSAEWFGISIPDPNHQSSLNYFQ